MSTPAGSGDRGRQTGKRGPILTARACDAAECGFCARTAGHRGLTGRTQGLAPASDESSWQSEAHSLCAYGLCAFESPRNHGNKGDAVKSVSCIFFQDKKEGKMSPQRAGKIHACVTRSSHRAAEPAASS